MVLFSDDFCGPVGLAPKARGQLWMKKLGEPRAQLQLHPKVSDPKPRFLSPSSRSPARAPH